MKHFIWILRLIFALPESWLARLDPDIAALGALSYVLACLKFKYFKAYFLRFGRHAVEHEKVEYFNQRRYYDSRTANKFPPSLVIKQSREWEIGRTSHGCSKYYYYWRRSRDGDVDLDGDRGTSSPECYYSKQAENIASTRNPQPNCLVARSEVSSSAVTRGYDLILNGWLYSSAKPAPR